VLALSRHGLLGEPDVHEPEHKENNQLEEAPPEGEVEKPQGESQNVDTITTPSVEEPRPGETPPEIPEGIPGISPQFYLPEQPEKEDETKEEQFVDVQLKEAIKIIKAHITMGSLGAAGK
jgi:hypothetical protein